jgi:rod shape-determining protein MreB
LPESLEISSVEVREAISGSVQVIVDTVKDALDESPPEIVSDLMETGFAWLGVDPCCRGCRSVYLMN